MNEIHRHDAADRDATGAGNAQREVELKLDVRDARTLDSLRQLADLTARYPMGPPEHRVLADTYVDTPDYRLLRTGFVLRLREDSGATRVTLKSLDLDGTDGLFDRFENEGDLPRDHAWQELAAWPQTVRDRVSELLGDGGPLVPICHVDHARVLRDVRAVRAPLARTSGTADGPLIGELALDTVRIAGPRPEDAGIDRRDDAGIDRREEVGGFAEVELEFTRESTPDDIHFISRWLRERPGLAPLRESKLERGLRRIAAHPAGGDAGARNITADMPMAEAGRLAWRVQLTAMLLEEAGARRGEDIEYVHRMRVATRRARAAHRVFGDRFDPEVARPLARGLRATARRLGKVRDLDVALDKLGAYRDGLPGRDDAGLEALAKHWRDRRRDAYRKLVTWLDGERYRAFITALDRFCKQPGVGVRAGDPTTEGMRSDAVSHVMPAAILERYAAVRAYESAIAAGASEQLLHALRIDCKRLRYSLEFVRHLLEGDGRTLIKQLRRLQDHLGDLNDAVVARDLLIAGASELHTGDGVRDYIERQEEIARQLTERFPEVWKVFIARRNRELLMGAIALL